MALQTEFPFTLPKGYVDQDGTLHRHGTMRLATARDEIEPLRDPRVSGSDDPYLTILVIGRVITELGSLSRIGPEQVENLFAADLAFLQDLYGIINFGDPADVAALQQSVLPPEPVAVVVPDLTVEDSDPELPAVEPAVEAPKAPRDFATAPRRRGVIEEVGTRSAP